MFHTPLAPIQGAIHRPFGPAVSLRSTPGLWLPTSQVGLEIHLPETELRPGFERWREVA